MSVAPPTRWPGFRVNDAPVTPALRAPTFCTGACRSESLIGLLLCGLFVVTQMPIKAAGQSDDFADPSQVYDMPSDWSQPSVIPRINWDEAFDDRNLMENTVPTLGRPSRMDRIVSDHRNYYDAKSFRLLAGGFLVGAVFANTSLDRQIQKHFQSSVASATSDDWYDTLHASKELGNGVYTLPVFAAAWASGAIFDESPLFVTTGRWGERTLRSFMVGAPPLILAQRLTGGSRPGENDRDSRWLPFHDTNGVSGHSFMSSLPFINAAMMTQRPWLKTAFYAGSLLGPISRVNDDAHYSSQIALGWWMACVAASAIDRTEMRTGQAQLYPYVTDGGYGGMFEFRF